MADTTKVSMSKNWVKISDGDCTAQANGKPRALSDKNIIIDSGCFHTGWLTALNIDSGVFIQADKLGSRTL